MRRFRNSRRFQPLARAISVISAVTILVTGVTFAALQSNQATLAGNSIQSATAGLLIGTNPNSFAISQTGFVFRNVIPGANANAEENSSFYLKNTGNTVLALKAAISHAPENNDGVDLSKVYVILTRSNTSSSQKLSLSSLISSQASGGIELTDNLAGNNTVAHYSAQVVMGADAFNGQSADITSIDLVFSGTAVTE